MKLEFDVDDEVENMIMGAAICVFTTFNSDGDRFIGITTQGTADVPEWIGTLEMAKMRLLAHNS